MNHPTNFPVSEQINRYVFNVVSSISTANGYSLDLSVQRQRVRNQTGHLCAVVCDCDPETILSDAPHGYTEVDKVFGVECYLRPSDDDETPLSYYISSLQSDITTAMLEDERMGGLALNVTPDECALLSDDDALVAGVMVPFVVRYRYRTDDPTQQ